MCSYIPVADKQYFYHMNFPSCNALKCRILRRFTTHAQICTMHRILSILSFLRQIRQISASKRSQNVIGIAKTDYYDFGRVLSVILPHPSILYSQGNPANRYTMTSRLLRFILAICMVGYNNFCICSIFTSGRKLFITIYSH